MRALFLLLLLPLTTHAQWQNLGTGTWQRTADGFKYRTTFGTNGSARWYTLSQVDSIAALKQTKLSGSGFVKQVGTTTSYDNSTYFNLGGTASQVAAAAYTANTSQAIYDINPNVQVGADGLIVSTVWIHDNLGLGGHASTQYDLRVSKNSWFNANIIIDGILEVARIGTHRDSAFKQHSITFLQDTLGTRTPFVKLWSGSHNGVFGLDTTDVTGLTNGVKAGMLYIDGNFFTVKKATTATLVSGTKTITIADATSSSLVMGITVQAIGGTVTTTWQYVGTCTSGSCTITAKKNDGTTNTLDTSVVAYTILN